MSHPQLTALQRKAGAGRPAPDHGVVTPATAFRLAISRAGQEALRLALVGGDVAESRLTLGAMESYLPEGGLCVLIRRGGGGVGLLALDNSLLAAVLQSKTTGKVTGATVAPRTPTQTDTILARGFLGVLLDSFGARLTGRPQARWAAGFQPRDRVPDIARLPHLLADVEYRGLSVDVDIAGGLRRGVVELIVPHHGGEADELPEPMSAPDPRVSAWRETLSERVLESPARLEAVLHRMHMPLSELTGLAPGAVLTIPAKALESVTLQGADGKSAAVARLGQADGRRALKIVSAVRGAADGAHQQKAEEPEQPPEEPPARQPLAIAHAAPAKATPSVPARAAVPDKPASILSATQPSEEG